MKSVVYALLLNYSVITNYVNDIRLNHSALGLKNSEKLNDVALSWGKYLAESGKFEHSKSNYGENIGLMGSNMTLGWKILIDMCYMEKSNYKEGKPAGHFTQLVWRNSKEYGIAAVSNGQNTYVVMEFNPPGNIAGQYGENVKI